jgi:hypothetical protein
MYPAARQKTIGVTGYSGVRNGLRARPSRRRSTMVDAPTSRKKNQKTGAVYSTMVANPPLVRAPSPTNANAASPWTRSAREGEFARSCHTPITLKALKSRPRA